MHHHVHAVPDWGGFWAAMAFAALYVGIPTAGGVAMKPKSGERYGLFAVAAVAGATVVRPRWKSAVCS